MTRSLCWSCVQKVMTSSYYFFDENLIKHLMLHLIEVLLNWQWKFTFWVLCTLHSVTFLLSHLLIHPRILLQQNIVIYSCMNNCSIPNSSGLYAHKITDDISQDCKFMKHLKRSLVLHGPFKDTLKCAPKNQLYAYTDRANVSSS